MNTLILKENSDLIIAGEILKNGGLVAIPTETVYGLAANALNPVAVKNIYKAKGRPSDNPLIVHVNSVKMVEELATDIPNEFYKLTKAFWPGPLTIILNKNNIIPKETSGGLDTVAFRMPESTTALEIIENANCPIAAPSANISGSPSPTTFKHVYNDMFGRIDAIVKGDDCEFGLESTVLTLCTNPPKILRPGCVSLEEIKEILPSVEYDDGVTTHIEDNQKVSSPGMKYRHYSPNAEIIVSKLSLEGYIKLLNSDKDACALCFDGEEQYFCNKAIAYGKIYNSKSQARNLFSALHKLDELGFKKVYARCPMKKNVGMAVYNRLIRSAGFHEITPEVQIIGLTGPTGAGKTMVSKEFEKNGYAVIDCDKVTRENETYTINCLNRLRDVFGNDIIENGSLNRRKLAEKAFSSKENTIKLNETVFPYIVSAINNKIEAIVNSGNKKILLDAPTLFEANADRFCTHIVAVIADKQTRLKRILSRDNITEIMAYDRMNSQYNDKFYTDRADYVIYNQGDNLDISEIISKLGTE